MPGSPRYPPRKYRSRHAPHRFAADYSDAHARAAGASAALDGFTPSQSRIQRKIAEGEVSGLGDISTLADPSVVDDLVANRIG